VRLTDVTTNPNYEQFDNVRSVRGRLPVDERSDGQTFGTWTDWRNTVAGSDPRSRHPTPPAGMSISAGPFSPTARGDLTPVRVTEAGPEHLRRSRAVEDGESHRGSRFSGSPDGSSQKQVRGQRDPAAEIASRGNECAPSTSIAEQLTIREAQRRVPDGASCDSSKGSTDARMKTTLSPQARPSGRLTAISPHRLDVLQRGNGRRGAPPIEPMRWEG